MIGVVDTKGGNLLSICKAVDYLGADVRLCDQPDELADCERLILPGVGAFGEVMGGLRSHGFDQALNEFRASGRPLLGVCLGMQLMARRSFEHGEFDGLGWIDADVVRLAPSDPTMRVPHVGWHDTGHRNGPLFRGVPEGADFYYVHSYHVVPDHDAEVDAWFDYGSRIVAAVHHENVFATQFHPEKSQEYGLVVLENFLSVEPAC